MKRLVKWLCSLLLLSTIWGAVCVYGALSGWWLNPIANSGDQMGFEQELQQVVNQQQGVNLALRLLRNGEPVFDYYKGSSAKTYIDRETVFPLASMSKFVAAFAVLQLVDSGALDLEKPISEYITSWQLPESGFDNELVTVRRLLSHTAGLTDGLGFGDYSKDEKVPSLEKTLNDPRASDAKAKIAVGLEPGSEWKYSGGGYLILELLVEEVTQMPFDVWLTQSVFKPLAMQRSTYQYLGNIDNAAALVDIEGKTLPWNQYASKAATGLSSSIEDLTKLATALIQKDDATVNEAKIMSNLTAPHAQKFGADIWGLGAMLYAPTLNGNFVFGHDGANDPAINTAFRINPDNGDAIIVLVTGHKTLASDIAYEWTLWQTGYPDILGLEKAVASATSPFLFGVVLLLVLVFVYVLWKRQNSDFI